MAHVSDISSIGSSGPGPTVTGRVAVDHSGARGVGTPKAHARRWAWLPFVCLLILLLGWATPSSAESRFEREAFGAFTVETEIYENSGPPIMHVADRWTKVKLIWRSSDGSAEMSLIDDGWQLAIDGVIVGRNGRCLTTTGPLGAAAPPPSNDAFWRWTAGEVERLMEKCEPGIPQRRTAYREEMAAAAADYPRAADAWKAAAVKAFRTLEGRCVETRRTTDSFPGLECVKWSGEQLDREKLAAIRRRCGIRSDVLVYKSNLLLNWRLKSGEGLDERLMACADAQLRPYKGVHIQLQFLKGRKG